MLSSAERWVSRSVVNRAYARGRIWDVEVVEGIIGRPLHHTLLIVESQPAVKKRNLDRLFLFLRLLCSVGACFPLAYDFGVLSASQPA